MNKQDGHLGAREVCRPASVCHQAPRKRPQLPRWQGAPGMRLLQGGRWAQEAFHMGQLFLSLQGLREQRRSLSRGVEGPPPHSSLKRLSSRSRWAAPVGQQGQGRQPWTPAPLELTWREPTSPTGPRARRPAASQPSRTGIGPTWLHHHQPSSARNDCPVTQVAPEGLGGQATGHRSTSLIPHGATVFFIEVKLSGHAAPGAPPCKGFTLVFWSHPVNTIPGNRRDSGSVATLGVQPGQFYA